MNFPKEWNPEIIKNLNESINFINFLKADNTFIVQHEQSLINNKNIKIRKLEDELQFQITLKKIENLSDKNIENVLLTNEIYNLIAYKLHITNLTGNIDGILCSGLINFVKTQNFSDNEDYYNRFIIPVNERIKFAYTIDTKSSIRTITLHNGELFNYDNFRCLLPINLNSKNFHFYIVKQQNENYLIIDSLDKLSFKEFHKNVHSILITFGFITGNLILDQGYFTLSSDKDFAKNNIHLFKTLYKIINSNPILYENNNAYVHTKNITDDDLNLKLNLISIDFFCEICKKINIDENLERSITLYLEACSQEIIVRCQLLSIAIETICGIINFENPETKERFLPDDDLWIEYRNELLKVHQKYKDRIRDKLKTKNDVFENGIMNLNRIGSTAALYKPFDIYGIDLLEDEKNSLEYRNRFLHGQNPFMMEKNLKNKSKFEMTYYTSLRLQMLFVKLLLKYFGYSGYILNFISIYRDMHNVDINESPFIKI